MTQDDHNSIATACPVCDSPDITEFIDLPNMPVYCNVLWPTREQAVEAPRADMKLAFCRDYCLVICLRP